MQQKALQKIYLARPAMGIFRVMATAVLVYACLKLHRLPFLISQAKTHDAITRHL
jgi:hypothetical protein